MAATIKIKNSSTASAVPTSSDLVQGELAVNVTDKRLFTENASGTVVELGTNPSTLTVTSGATIQGLTVGKGAGAVSTNTAIGASALAANTSGTFSTAVGYEAGKANTNGYSITAVGARAGWVVNGATNFTAVGTDSGRTSTTAASASFFGANSGFSNTTGSYLVAVGDGALYSNTTASLNTAVGYQAMYSNTTGTSNAALGYQALYSNTTASQNTAVGRLALVYNTTGSSNTGIGHLSLYENTTGSFNTALGDQALRLNTTASYATAVGYQAGYTSNANAGVFVGYQAGYNTTGLRSTFVGTDSGSAVTSGTKNTILGCYTGNQGGLDIRTASNYIVLSDGDGNPRGIFDSSGNLLVGKTAINNTNTGITLDLGSTGVKVVNSASTNAADGFQMYSTGAGAYRFYVNFAGTIFATSTTISAISDIRFKENVRDLDAGLAEVMALKPRLYDWKEGKGADVKNARGFIAQEFEEVFPDLIDEWKDEAPEGEEPYKSVRQDLIPVLVKAIQEQQAIITALTARIEALENQA